LSCISELQKFNLEYRIKKNNPVFDDIVIEGVIKIIDRNAKRLCDEKKIKPPPSDEIIDETYTIKMTKFANCLSMKV